MVDGEWTATRWKYASLKTIDLFGLLDATSKTVMNNFWYIAISMWYTLNCLATSYHNSFHVICCICSARRMRRTAHWIYWYQLHWKNKLRLKDHPKNDYEDMSNDGNSGCEIIVWSNISKLIFWVVFWCASTTTTIFTALRRLYA